MTARRDDELLGAIDRQLSAPLASTRAAEERVRRRLRAPQPARRSSPLAWVALGSAAILALALAIGWTQNVRVGVAGNGIPFLYRSEIARVEFRGIADGWMAAGERFVERGDGAPPRELSAVVEVSLTIDRANLPADVELRFREDGEDPQKGLAPYGILARTAGITDARATLRGAVVSYVAPLPPQDRGTTKRYDIVLWVGSRTGTVEIDSLTLEVTRTPDGQRVRLIR